MFIFSNILQAVVEQRESCFAGGAEGCYLDGRVPDGGDVCRPAGGHCGGGQSGGGDSRGVEDGGERQPHRFAGVSRSTFGFKRFQTSETCPLLVAPQSEPRPSGASHLLDPGSGRSLPHVGLVWREPGPGAAIP